jgi:hypothetical protein
MCIHIHPHSYPHHSKKNACWYQLRDC